jgi:hypothetical protein
MSLQTQHDPKNEAEITYWNSAGGRHWVERQQSRDIVLGPILQATLERAQLRQGERLSISAAVPVRARLRSPSALVPPGRCWALTFQRRCYARRGAGAAKRRGPIRTRAERVGGSDEAI